MADVMRYLARDATIAGACEWLRARTGQEWTLARLLEEGLTPWFWLDFNGQHPAIFAFPHKNDDAAHYAPPWARDRTEGFLSRMLFAGDLCRLEADGAEALVSMFTAQDGKPVKIHPPLRVPLTDLRFKREDVEALASAQVALVTGQSAKADPNWMDRAAEMARRIIEQQKASDLYPSQTDIADQIARHFRSEGITGAGRKPLTGAYIKRHVLVNRGISSQTGRKLSTRPRQGK